MHTRIFINYRRSDTQADAGRLKAELEGQFGAGSVFFDTSSVAVATPWPDTISGALSAAEVVLVLIGPAWAEAKDDRGQPRLEQTGDWVRREIETALVGRTLIVPVLIDLPQMPGAHTLPGGLCLLPQIQALTVRREHWDSDVRSLYERLHTYLVASPARAPDRTVRETGVEGRWRYRFGAETARNRNEGVADIRWTELAGGQMNLVVSGSRLREVRDGDTGEEQITWESNFASVGHDARLRVEFIIYSADGSQSLAYFRLDTGECQAGRMRGIAWGLGKEDSQGPVLFERDGT